MVDGHQSLCSGNGHPSLRSQCIPFHGCQPLWMGSSSRTDETILSWSLNGRPVPAPYQYSGNNGHSFCTEESRTIHKPFVLRFPPTIRQWSHISTNEEEHIPRPMRGGMGNSSLVPGTGYCTQNSSYPRQIQYTSRQSLEIGQTSQYKMVFGSISGEFSFSNAQFSQCGFVCDSIQSQTPIVYISSSRQTSFTDR